MSCPISFSDGRGRDGGGRDGGSGPSGGYHGGRDGGAGPSGGGGYHDADFDEPAYGGYTTGQEAVYSSDPPGAPPPRVVHAVPQATRQPSVRPSSVSARVKGVSGSYGAVILEYCHDLKM